MNWEDLKDQARKILENSPEGEFKDESFTTGTGGSPNNLVGVPEVHRSDVPGYNTVRNRRSSAGEVVVRCRDTGAVSAHGRTIYQAENGTLFVYQHRSGDAGNFDAGWLKSPSLKE